jgi:hypothetical protein
MIVHDLDILRARRRPAEAHAEPIVHAETVLPSAIALEGFQSVATPGAVRMKFYVLYL